MTRTRGAFGTVLAFALLLGACLVGCGDGTGVCTGCCGSGGSTYCKDGWTEEECEEWDSRGVNGVDWHFHEGQTCAERGTPETP